MKNLRSWEWWDRATVRAIKTAAQAILAVLGTGLIGIMEVDWLNLMSIALGSAFFSIVTSMAGLPEVDDTPPDKDGEEDGKELVFDDDDVFDGEDD
ncbi:holin [uncultured Dubosiella sp.]|uniref:holin n=1 Tax=uncultured Dubosiella sp. TaxID=1937011 RepID=UPI00258BEEDB|nr:holin [uncultured Dubosiella sp.]